jgi:uncharacterized alkaline shock family protein YloU
MSVNTSNAYGRITVTEEAIAQVAAGSAIECYGIVDLVSRRFFDTLADLFKRRRKSRGVKVVSSGDRIFIELNVIMKYGVSIDAVAESLKRSIKYDVEKFTGMLVDTINVNIYGVRV